MDLSFSPSELAFQEEARAWLFGNVPKKPYPKDGEALREFDLRWQRKLYEAGYAGIDWPKEYGGRGLSPIEQLIWYDACARAGAPPPGSRFVGVNHAGPTLIISGSEAQKEFHLGRILRGEVIWCQGFSEPDAGSDLASLSTRAEVDGGELVVNGSKIWTSFAHLADYQELLVRTDPGGRRHSGLTWVICDMRSPGLTVRPITSLNGAHHLNQVFYDNVRIPVANVVGEINDGWRVAMSTLSFERGTAFTEAQMTLAMEVDQLIERAMTRTGPGGKPAFVDSLIGHRLTKLRAETAALRAMTYLSVSRNLRRSAPGPDGSLLKLMLSRLRKEVKLVAVDLLGAGVLTMNDATDSYLRAFAASVGGGTDEIQHNIVAERLLGLPRRR